MKYFLLLLTLVAAQIATAQEPDWFVKLRKIQPGVSTKLDVERLFNNPKSAGRSLEERGEVAAYWHRDGYLMVTIAVGTCPSFLKENCSVEKGTVIEAIFSPTIKMDKKTINFQDPRFKALMEGDNPTMHYVDKSAGLDYIVDNDRITHIRIFHPAVYNQVIRNISAGG